MQLTVAAAETPRVPAIDFHAVFDASPNAYMLLDRELRYVDANRTYLKVTGRRLEELIGRRDRQAA